MTKYLVTVDIEVDFSGGEYTTEWVYDVFIGNILEGVKNE